MSEETLFSKIGGQTRVDKIVDMVLDKAVTDPRLRNRFVDRDVTHIRSRMKEYLGAVFKGESPPEGVHLDEVHRGMGITPEEFDLIVSFFDKQAWDAECSGEQSQQVAAMVNSLRDFITRK